MLMEYILSSREAYTKPSEQCFLRALIGSLSRNIPGYSRIFLARMTAHGSDNMASRFPESLSEAQISEINEIAIPINKKRATKFVLGVFQVRFYF